MLYEPAHVISRCLAFWFLVYSQSALRGGGCGGTGVAHNCVFLSIVKLLPVVIRRAEYTGEYFKRPRVLVTFHLMALVKETMFRRLVVLPSSGELTDHTLLGARDYNSFCLRRTAVRNVVFPRPKRPVIPMRQFSAPSLLRTFMRGAVDTRV